MNDAHAEHDPRADHTMRHASPDRPAASLPVRLLVMALLFVLSIGAIWSIDGRILHTMGEHDRRTHADAPASD